MTARSRRGTRFAALAAGAAFVVTLVGCAPEAPATPEPSSVTSETSAPADLAVDADQQFLDLEDQSDARVGVYAIDTETGRTVEYRADERFGFASTIKALAVGAVLAETTDEEFAAAVPVDADDLVPYSPIVEQYVGGSVTLQEAADAAIRYSDNAAANLLVEHLGGPDALEDLLRAAGDDTTMIDRIEPELNDVAPGDDRDTSTPRALADSLSTYALGDTLSGTDRDLLVEMLRGNTTGDALIRAAAPEGWAVGDKTGTAAYGTRNDIAIVWPPEGGAPIVLAVLSDRSAPDAEPSDALIASAASIVFDALSAG